MEGLAEAVFRNLPLGITVYQLTDRDDSTSLVLRYANEFASAQLGFDLGEHVGKRLIDIWPHVLRSERFEVYAEVVRSGQPRRIGEVLSFPPHRAGEMWLMMEAFPLPDQCVCISFVDVTRRKQAELFLDSVLENIPAMVFVKDAAELRFVRFNRAGQELVGYSAEELLGKTDHDLFPRAEADFFTAMDREVLSGGKLVEIARETIDTRDRGQRLLRTKKIPLLDESGQARHLLGISEDITEQVQRVAELEKERHFVNMLGAAAVAANEALSLEVAVQTCLQLICAGCGFSVGLAHLASDDSERISVFVGFASTPSRFDRFIAARRALPVERHQFPGVVLAGQGATWIRRIAAIRELPWREEAIAAGLVSALAVPISIDDLVVGALEFLLDEPQQPDARLLDIVAHVGTQLGRVAERERASAQLKLKADELALLSTIDDLTGLHNRRGFRLLAEQQIRLAVRSDARLMLFFIDVDGLKAINDKLGHELGDRALVEAANVLRSVFRASDIVARIGGDEFVVLTLQGSTGCYDIVVGRLEERTAARNRSAPGFELRLSIGASVSEPAARVGLDELLDQADADMYRRRRARAGPAGKR